MNCFIESGELEIDETGNRTFLIDKIVPDATMTTDTSLSVEFKCRLYTSTRFSQQRRANTEF